MELTVKGDLLDALGVKPIEGMTPTPELVVAAALQRLATGKGLAQHDNPEHSVVRDAGVPAQALAILERLASPRGSQVASDDDVRNALYDALVGLSNDTAALQGLSKPRGLSANQMLEFAQIYWNLDAQEPRRALPIQEGGHLSSGLQAYIKVAGADLDYADLDLQRRAAKTPGYSRGAGAFHKRGARVAALVARRLLNSTRADVDGARLRSKQTGRGNEWTIVWASPIPRASTRTAVKATPSTGVSDPTIAGLHQLRNRNLAEGDLGNAAILSAALVSILQASSEKSPGDHESQLADEALQAGLVATMLGRVEEALGHFIAAERVSQTLSDLDAGEAAHRLQLTIARTMIGVLRLQAGDFAEAAAALDDAVALAQVLTDEDANHEDMLAASLGMLGMLHIQTGETERAMATLRRAVTISQKIVKRNPGDDTNALQLANMLHGLGGVQYQDGDSKAAEECLTRSLATLKSRAYRGFEGHQVKLLRASSQFVLGTIYTYADRFKEAEEMLTSSVALGQELVDERPDVSAQVNLAGALHTLGLLYVITDREQEGERALVASIANSRELAASHGAARVGFPQTPVASLYLGSALYYLGLLNLMMEHDVDAAASLEEAIRVFDQRGADEADQAMRDDALESLAELYRRQGREAEAERALDRRRFDGQTPDSPALA